VSYTRSSLPIPLFSTPTHPPPPIHPPKLTEFNYEELRMRSSHMSAFMNMNNFVLKRTCGHVDKGQTGQSKHTWMGVQHIKKCLEMFKMEKGNSKCNSSCCFQNVGGGGGKLLPPNIQYPCIYKIYSLLKIQIWLINGNQPSISGTNQQENH